MSRRPAGRSPTDDGVARRDRSSRSSPNHYGLPAAGHLGLAGDRTVPYVGHRDGARVLPRVGATAGFAFLGEGASRCCSRRCTRATAVRPLQPGQRPRAHRGALDGSRGAPARHRAPRLTRTLPRHWCDDHRSRRRLVVQVPLRRHQGRPGALEHRRGPGLPRRRVRGVQPGDAGGRGAAPRDRHRHGPRRAARTTRDPAPARGGRGRAPRSDWRARRRRRSRDPVRLIDAGSSAAPNMEDEPAGCSVPRGRRDRVRRARHRNPLSRVARGAGGTGRGAQHESRGRPRARQRHRSRRTPLPLARPLPAAAPVPEPAAGAPANAAHDPVDRHRDRGSRRRRGPGRLVHSRGRPRRRRVHRRWPGTDHGAARQLLRDRRCRDPARRRRERCRDRRPRHHPGGHALATGAQARRRQRRPARLRATRAGHRRRLAAGHRPRARSCCRRRPRPISAWGPATP